MKKFLITALGVLMLGLTFQVQAALSGSQDNVSNGCISPIQFFVRQDCSYNGSQPVGFPGQSYWGPIEGGEFYLPGGIAAGDATVDLPVSMDLTVTGNNGVGDTLSGTISIAAGEHSVGCTQNTALPRCEERWDSIVHVLTSAPLSIATANAAGGFDYELTTLGVPTRKPPCVFFAPFPPVNCTNLAGNGINFAFEAFPSVTPSIPYFGSAWKFPPTETGMATFEENPFNPFDVANIGATTTATLSGYSCVGPEVDSCPDPFSGIGGSVACSVTR